MFPYPDIRTCDTKNELNKNPQREKSNKNFTNL